jgi:hypothetical protein
MLTIRGARVCLEKSLQAIQAVQQLLLQQALPYEG